MSSISKNKHLVMIRYGNIVKNSFLLYFRQLIAIFLSFFTTRLLLRSLGVSDFGLYNVVGGILPLISFFTSAMTSATQRYIAVGLGKGDDMQLKKVFSTIVLIYWACSLLTLIFAESVGLWYLNAKMNIPADRLVTANIIYQISVVSSVISILSTPYSSAIVAHERLDVYAYVGIMETVLRLLIALVMFWHPMADNLLFYATGLFAVSLNSTVIYRIFCRKHFTECTFKYVFERGLCREILSYTSYNMIGNVAIIGKNQGGNLLLNLFFGTAVNAAQGIAMQVVNALNSFISNIYLSTRPQMIKLYSADNWAEAWKLLCLSTKYSFYVLLLISVPILLSADCILTIWLGKYPVFTDVFIKLILVDMLIQTTTSQLFGILQAANRIKSYQLSSSIILLLVVPVSYALYKWGYAPSAIYVVTIILRILSTVVFLYIMRQEIANFRINLFFKDILRWLTGPAAITLVVVLTADYLVGNVIAKCVICMALCLLGIGTLGVTPNERRQILAMVKKSILKINQRNERR